MFLTEPVPVKPIINKATSAAPNLFCNDITMLLSKDKLPSLLQRFSFIKHIFTSYFHISWLTIPFMANFYFFLFFYRADSFFIV